MKQGANSAVRFTSFATIQQYMLDWTKPASGKLSPVSTFGVGAAAGLITVCGLPWIDRLILIGRRHYAT